MVEVALVLGQCRAAIGRALVVVAHGGGAAGAALVELRPVLVGVDARRPHLVEGALITTGGAAGAALVELRPVVIGVDARRPRLVKGALFACGRAAGAALVELRPVVIGVDARRPRPAEGAAVPRPRRAPEGRAPPVVVVVGRRRHGHPVRPAPPVGRLVLRPDRVAEHGDAPAAVAVGAVPVGAAAGPGAERAGLGGAAVGALRSVASQGGFCCCFCPISHFFPRFFQQKK